MNEAKILDLNDPFQPMAHCFDLPHDGNGNTYLYMNGNSLGPKLKSVDSAIASQCTRWGTLGVRGHFDGDEPWVNYQNQILPPLANLVGAKPHEVVTMGTLTANMHLLFMSFYHPTPQRYKIVRFAGFPSDTYALDSQIEQRLLTLNQFGKVEFTDAIIEIRRDASGYISPSHILEVIKQQGHQIAVVWLEGVHFLTGQRFDIQSITHIAHQYGCLVGFDLAHAIGNIPLRLNEWKVDFAVWCHYKYLSAGPGAIAGLYIDEAHHQRFRLTGWWGNRLDNRFDMLDRFEPALGALGWQLSNPEIFSLMVLRESLKLFSQINLDALYEKNRRLVNYLERLICQKLPKIRIITPKNPEERGCQLSLALEQSNVHWEHVLLEQGIICDVRPGVLRIAPVGLYHTFQDLERLVDGLMKIIL